MKFLGPGEHRSGHQVTKQVQCQVQILIIFMHPPHPQFLTDFFQTFSVCLFRRDIQDIVRFFYIADLGSAGGHNLVMLNIWENIQMAPIPKNTRDSCFILPLLCLNTPLDNKA